MGPGSILNTPLNKTSRLIDSTYQPDGMLWSHDRDPAKRNSMMLLRIGTLVHRYSKQMTESWDSLNR